MSAELYYKPDEVIVYTTGNFNTDSKVSQEFLRGLWHHLPALICQSPEIHYFIIQRSFDGRNLWIYHHQNHMLNIQN